MHNSNFLRRLLTVAAAASLSLSAHCFAEEEAQDYHFRPFWIEPADRVELGSGHLMGGMAYEKRPETGTQRRTTAPLELTLGLGYGFSAVVMKEAAVRTVFDDNSTGSAAEREMKLRYSFPEWNGVHLLAMTGVSRPTGNANSRFFNGLSLAIDTPAGTIGAAQVWERKAPEDPRVGTQSAINLFRTGLGRDGHWAAGGEIRYVRTAHNEKLTHWMLGVGRVVGKGVMADLAVGSRFEHSASRLITAGLAWFF